MDHRSDRAEAELVPYYHCLGAEGVKEYRKKNMQTIDGAPTGFSMTSEIRPATWEGFEGVMGDKGGCGGGWCMLWLLSTKDLAAGKGAGNRDAMKALFDGGHVPGLIACHQDEPAGWLQIDRRSAFPKLTTSRILYPVDDAEVWSVSCFFVHKGYLRKGLSSQLLNAAMEWAQSQGATVVEGYPIDKAEEKYPAVYAWTGFVGAYLESGFTEVARRSDTRPLCASRSIEMAKRAMIGKKK